VGGGAGGGADEREGEGVMMNHEMHEQGNHGGHGEHGEVEKHPLRSQLAAVTKERDEALEEVSRLAELVNLNAPGVVVPVKRKAGMC
jgi:hypothetical protein